MVSTRKRASVPTINDDGEHKHGKRVASSAEVQNVRPAVEEKLEDLIEVKKREHYNRIMQRNVACERPVAITELTDTLLPAILERRGWKKICLVKVPPATGLVREFYASITHENINGEGSLHSTVREKEVEISAAVIARVLDVSRKCSPQLTPKEKSDMPNLDKVAKELCNDPKAKWDLSSNVIEQASMSANYRLISMVLNSNIHPRMHSTTVSADRAKMLYAIGQDHYIDLPLYMFNVMQAAYKSQSKTDVLPFGSIITKILRKFGIRASPGEPVGKIPGPINLGTWNKSNAHSRGEGAKNKIPSNEDASPNQRLRSPQCAGPSKSNVNENDRLDRIMGELVKLGGRLNTIEEFVRIEITDVKARMVKVEEYVCGHTVSEAGVGDYSNIPK